MVFYAVANGKKQGIYLTWDECKTQILLFNNAKYKKFDTEKEAEEYIELYNNTNKSKKQKEKVIKSIHDEEESYDIYVYTDGACIKNGSSNAKAGYGIYFGENDTRNISKSLVGKNQTNNIAELTAIIECINIIKNTILTNYRVAIITDSIYSIRCITSYGYTNNKNNWVNDIPNKELVKQAYELYTSQTYIKIYHIDAHTNNKDIHSIGNDNADKLANKAINIIDNDYENKKINIENNRKIYLHIPFEKKDEAKLKGTKWDYKKKLWYITEDNPNKNELISSYGIEK
jgi:ribonuclease HI